MKKYLVILAVIITIIGFTNTLFAQASIYQIKDKYGVKGKDGTIIIKPLYNSIKPIPKHNSLLIVSIGKKYGIINTKEDIVVPITFQELKMLNDSLVKTMISNKYGIITVNGKEIVSPIYRSMGMFSNELLNVQLDNKWGFLNIKGEVQIPIEYEYVRDFKNEYAIVDKNKKSGVIDTDGKLMIPTEFDYIRQETSSNKLPRLSQYFITEINKKYGLYVLNFATSTVGSKSVDDSEYASAIYYATTPLICKQICTPKYDYISLNNDGSWQVTLNELYGIINEEGVEIIPPTYRSITVLNHGYFSVSMQDNNVFSKNPTGRQPSGLVSPKGKLLTPMKYNHIGEYKNGLFEATDFNHGRAGVIDETGKEIIPLDYLQIFDLNENFIAAKAHKKDDSKETTMSEALAGAWGGIGIFGVLNRKNETVIPFIYPYLRLTKNDFVIAQDPKGKYGVLSTKNEILKPFAYSDVQLNIEKDHFIGIIDGVHYLTKENGFNIKNVKYAAMKWYGNTLCLFIENNKLGVIDITGKIIQEAKFEGFQNNKDSDQYGYSFIVMDGKQGYIDAQGKIVIKCQFEEISIFKDGYATVVLNGKKRYIDSKGNFLN